MSYQHSPYLHATGDSHHLGRTYINSELAKKLDKDYFIDELKFYEHLQKLDEPQLNTVNLYINLYNWLNRTHILALLFEAKLQHGLSCLTLKIIELIGNELKLAELKKLPTIITPEEFYKNKFLYSNKPVAVLLKDSYDPDLIHNGIMDNPLENYVYYNSLLALESQEPEKMFLENSRTLIMQYLPGLLAYNEAVNIIYNYFDFPLLKTIFSVNINVCYDNLQSFNERVKFLRRIITSNSTEEEYETKYKIIKKYFATIDFEKFKPDQKNIEYAIMEFPSLFCTCGMEKLIDILRK